MTDVRNSASLAALLRAVRRLPPPPPNRGRDAVATEQVFFRCLVVVLLVTQLLGLWGGYRFLERFAHPFAAPQPEVFVALPDAK